MLLDRFCYIKVVSFLPPLIPGTAVPEDPSPIPLQRLHLLLPHGRSALLHEHGVWEKPRSNRLLLYSTRLHCGVGGADSRRISEC